MVAIDGGPANCDSSQLVHIDDQQDIWNFLQSRRPPPFNPSKLQVLHIKEWHWLVKQQYRWSNLADFVSQIFILRVGSLTLMDIAYEKWYPSSLQLLAFHENVKVFSENSLDAVSDDEMEIFRGLIQLISYDAKKSIEFDRILPSVVWDAVVKKIIRHPDVPLEYYADDTGITQLEPRCVFDRESTPCDDVKFETVILDTGKVNFQQTVAVMEWSNALVKISLKIVEAPEIEEWKKFIFSVARSNTIETVSLSGVLQEDLWLDSLVMLLANPSIRFLTYLFPIEFETAQENAIVAALKKRSKVENLTLQENITWSRLKTITNVNKSKRIMMTLGKEQDAKLIHLKLKTERVRNNPDILFDFLVEHHAICERLHKAKCRDELAASEAQIVSLLARIECLKSHLHEKPASQT